MADALPVPACTYPDVSGLVRVCGCMRDVLSPSLTLRVSPEHKMVCSNPISPERETSSPKIGFSAMTQQACQ